MFKGEYKGIGIRFLAQLLDWIILGIIYAILGAAIFGAFTWSVTGIEALPLLGLNALIWIIYYTVLEGSSGATIGKKIVKIKVMKEDGSRCNYVAAFIRNILRIIDVLPFIYIIGMILIARSEKKQRLGDIAAKTVVVGAQKQIEALSIDQTKNKFCIECGASIPIVATFCPKCGANQ